MGMIIRSVSTGAVFGVFIRDGKVKTDPWIMQLINLFRCTVLTRNRWTESLADAMASCELMRPAEHVSFVDELTNRLDVVDFNLLEALLSWVEPEEESLMIEIERDVRSERAHGMVFQTHP